MKEKLRRIYIKPQVGIIHVETVSLMDNYSGQHKPAHKGGSLSAGAKVAPVWEEDEEE